MVRFARFFSVVSFCLFGTTCSVLAETDLPPDQFFDQHVQPILAAHCFKCHGAEAKIKGGLKLTDHASILKGGESGSIIEDGLLLDAINYEGYEMPPSGKLPAEELAILTKWVKLGAPWSKTTEDFGFQGEQENAHGPPQVNEETKKFWSVSYTHLTLPTTPYV